MQENKNIRVDGTKLNLQSNMNLVESVYEDYKRLFKKHYEGKPIGMSYGCVMVLDESNKGRLRSSSAGSTYIGLTSHLSMLKTIMSNVSDNVKPVNGVLYILDDITEYVMETELNEDERECIEKIREALNELAAKESRK